MNTRLGRPEAADGSGRSAQQSVRSAQQSVNTWVTPEAAPLIVCTARGRTRAAVSVGWRLREEEEGEGLVWRPHPPSAVCQLQDTPWPGAVRIQAAAADTATRAADSLTDTSSDKHTALTHHETSTALLPYPRQTSTAHLTDTL